jgi:hypothetical protein
MKRLFLLLSLLLSSCDNRLTGDCYPIIPDRLLFSSQGGIDSARIGYRWWFSNLYKECELIEPEKVECPWLSAEKKDSATAIVLVKQNNTGKERSTLIRIKTNDDMGGECSENSGWISIHQCFEPTDMELSKEELLFSAEGGMDSVIVATDRESWLEHPVIGVRYENIRYNYRKGFDFSDYSHIKDPWFAIIDIVDGEKIIFSVSKNESGKERTSTATLDPYNCGPSIKIIQSAE